VTDPIEVNWSDVKAALEGLGIGALVDTERVEIRHDRIAVTRVRAGRDGAVVGACGDPVRQVTEIAIRYPGLDFPGEMVP
jgi:hypothetical protein